MRVFKEISSFVSQCRPAATVGVFDGVHKGHIEIVKRLCAKAREKHCDSVVVTFEPHPRLALNPEGEITLLQTIDEKLARFEEAGVDSVLIIPFDAVFAKTPPEQFVKNILVDILHISYIITGYDHFFGKGRSGDTRFLTEMGKKYGFTVEEMPPVIVDQIAVSSSVVRKALLEGNVALASHLLGYNYSLQGAIVSGNRIGRNIGYPTANIRPAFYYKLVPAQGVYATLLKIDGIGYKGMTNIGFRPTIDAHNLTIEMNIFNFNKDIYGETATLSFVERIRDEKRFNGLESLKEQLSLDKIAATKILRNF